MPLSTGSELDLENYVNSDRPISNQYWLIIGSQIRTIHGGYFDLLAIGDAGSLILMAISADAAAIQNIRRCVFFSAPSWPSCATVGVNPSTWASTLFAVDGSAPRSRRRPSRCSC